MSIPPFLPFLPFALSVAVVMFSLPWILPRNPYYAAIITIALILLFLLIAMKRSFKK
jgi:NADH:ubiquinone oxidoreductase subunit 6 (subunit J)